MRNHVSGVGVSGNGNIVSIVSIVDHGSLLACFSVKRNDDEDLLSKRSDKISKRV